jgi:hypothetical protein
MTQRQLAPFLLALVLLAGGCGDPDPVNIECGTGTEERDGRCVAIVNVMTTCAPGTVLDEDTDSCVSFTECAEGTELNPVTESCEPIAECGPDTRLDLGTRTCVPIETCGEGTTLDPVTKQCVPDAVCGVGTVANPQTGLCEPVFPCEEGSTLNEETGRCENELGCGTGQVIIDGKCELENQELIDQADALETLPDLNDPAFGGTPESITLEAMGEETIFVGNIGRPSDFDGDGDDDQDRDFWRFSGTVGQTLDIRVVTAGLPQPTFIVHGPNDYRREAPLGWIAEAQRHVVLPYTGDYEIEVVPTVFVSAQIQLGGSEADYIGIVEEIAAPVLTALVPQPAAAPALFTGELIDLSDNGFSITTPARSALELSLVNLGASAEPVLLFFRRDGSFAGEVILDLARSTRVNAFTALDDELYVIVDFVRARGPQTGFQVELIAVPLHDLGTLDQTLASTSTSVPAVTTIAWAFDIPTGVVLNAQISVMTDPDVQLIAPSGVRSSIDDNDSLLFYASPGEYIVFAHNDTTILRNNVALTLSPEVPIDLGLLDPSGTSSATASGPELGFGFNQSGSVWIVARHATGGLFDIHVQNDYGIGDSELRVFSEVGAQIRVLDRPHLDRHAGVLVDAMELIMIELTSADPAVLDWRTTVVAEPPPPNLDAEPNDTLVTAIDIGPLPVVLVGGTGTQELDYYTFQLPAPLAPHQSVEIAFDNLATQSMSQVSDAGLINVFDQNLVKLASIQKPESGSFAGVIGPSSVTYVGAFEGPGPFFIEVSSSLITAPTQYQLRVRVVDTPMEDEPNDDVATANVLGPLPASIYGFRATDAGGDPEDVFRLDLAQAIPAGRSLSIFARNFETNNGFTAQLEDELGNIIRQQPGGIASAVNMVIQVPELAAGTYYIRLAGGSSATRAMFKLTVAIGPWTEAEPNDTAANAVVLGVLSTSSTSLSIEGAAATGETDLFLFDLAAPLATNQSIEVRLWNQSDTTSMRLDFYDGVTPGTSPSFGFDSNWINWVYAAPDGTGPFAVRVQGGTGSLGGDHYRLRVGFGPRSETEPNDLEADALDISVLPAVVRGQAAQNDRDAYRVVLPADLAAGEVLRARVQNLADTTRMSIELFASEFTTQLLDVNGAQVTADSTPGLAAGTYYLVVGQDNGATTTTDHYDLTVEVANVE